uniref:Uncharacterized protein n=1 Tax=uncultured prokaryote TaxID=198431 RepID=A0A0H5Q6Z7_9ZZZZ|nr:hypothetical protein [uncultured prokaryote]
MADITSNTPGNQLNNDKESVGTSMHPYDLSRIYQTTTRYGLIQPHFYHFGLEKDEVHNSSREDIMTLPMQSPAFTNIKRKSNYFFVPKSALLPVNWEKVNKEPSFGDDIPNADVGLFGRHPLYVAVALLKMSLSFVALPTDESVANKQLYAKFFGNFNDLSYTESISNAIKLACRFAILSEALFSSKSLLSSLGSPLNSYYHRLLIGYTYEPFVSNPALAFETAFSSFFEKVIFKKVKSVTIEGKVYNIKGNGTHDGRYITQSEFIDLFRFRPEFVGTIHLKTPVASWSDYTALINELFDALTSTSSNIPLLPIGLFNIQSSTEVDNPEAINFAKYDLIDGFNYDSLLSYQMGVACQYNNDQTDYVLNPALWLSVMQSMLLRMVSDDGTHANDKLILPTFEYNGASYVYDCVSGYNISRLIDYLEHLDTHTSGYNEEVYTYDNLDVSLSALQNIFCFQPSLKYFDYFLGGRTRIYSVGDNIVDDPSNMAEVAKGLIYQKAKMIFARVGNDYDDYTKEVLNAFNGIDQYHDILPCGGSEYSIQSYNVENNTQQGQGELVSSVNSGGSLGSCDLTLQVRGCVIGVSFVTAERIYSRASESFYYKKDRLDHFNPLLQHTGDISLNRFLLDTSMLNNPADMSKVYSYMVKDMDYKQTFHHADGAFLDSLPSWSFIADLVGEPEYFALCDTLNQYSIRELPSVFDRFWENIPYISEGTRFHYILNIYNDTTVVRNMIPKPQLMQ